MKRLRKEIVWVLVLGLLLVLLGAGLHAPVHGGGHVDGHGDVPADGHSDVDCQLCCLTLADVGDTPPVVRPRLFAPRGHWIEETVPESHEGFSPSAPRAPPAA